VQRAGGRERAVLISVAVRREGGARHPEKASTADILSRRSCPKMSRHHPPIRANKVARCLREQRDKGHVMSIAGPGNALLWEKVR